ncbi:ABC transporter ATP-binding protein [Desulforhopalus sp. IMCC35007]|uniref:ABC transporter ATP-binding protein n=1 Tax=Desulforhopalus sp. IMCC35007 TaxID=2569543 RepID=UPI0010ADB8DE|nr:ATP-binding cassette domain-containing protein [Desulforhopalus sp. IMCC35007]TKB06765.1 ATP-binding cassette domain-containing protein [Desulforhopalus sp. IMCC35007]
MKLSIENLYKTFSGFVALDRINMEVGETEFVCLLGPSGCGKTTLLRIIAGLLDFDGGAMSLGDRDLVEIAARDRGFGLVFQSYSLFPNMTVKENVGYGLKVQKVDKKERGERVEKLLELIKLPDLTDRYPHQLSGGQQQRVAIARALAVEPCLLLLDEPLSALDARVRAEMRYEIREMQQRLGIPTIMVTHDQEEALTMADKIICMKDGRIEQIGTPRELYAEPATRFVADFVGVSNIFSTAWVRENLPKKMGSRPEGRENSFDFAIRPEQLVIDGRKDGADIKNMQFLGNLSRITLNWHGQDVVVELQGYPQFKVGSSVAVIVPDDCGRWVKA